MTVTTDRYADAAEFYDVMAAPHWQAKSDAIRECLRGARTDLPVIVIGFLPRHERDATWSFLADRLAPGAPVVVEVMPIDAPVTIPPMTVGDQQLRVTKPLRASLANARCRRATSCCRCRRS